MTSLILSHKSLSCISMHTSIYADMVSVQGATFPIATAHSLITPADCLLYDPGRNTHTLKHTHTHSCLRYQAMFGMQQQCPWSQFRQYMHQDLASEERQPFNFETGLRKRCTFSLKLFDTVHPLKWSVF